MHRRAFWIAGLWLFLWSQPIFAQAQLALYPKPCAEGGFGRDNRFNWSTQFTVTQPIRVTHLCRLWIWPTDPLNGMTIQLWSLKTPGQLLASALVGTNMGTYCLAGLGTPAVLIGTAITPIELAPGDYLIHESVRERGDTRDHWFFSTKNFLTGPGITFVRGHSDYFSNNNGSSHDTLTFGPSFAYELVPMRPRLEIRLVNNQARISWPQSSTPVVLQTASRLSSPVWEDVPIQPLVEGTSYYVDVPLPHDAAFYTLRLAE